jgi:hypothetical protein
MFIVFGEYDTESEIGVVADTCRVCGDLNVLRASRIFRKSHVYFLPVGSGKVKDTLVTCAGCNGKASFEPTNSTEFLPEKEALSMSLGQILWKTNPTLAESTAFRMRLENKVAQRDLGSLAGPDPRIQLAFVKIAELGSEDESTKLSSLLERWATLDESMRHCLLRDIDAAVAEQKRWTRTKSFINVVSQQFEPEVGGLTAIATFAAILAFGGAGSAEFLKGQGLLIGFVALLVVAAISAFTFFWQYNRWARKKFFNETFLQQAVDRQIDLIDVMRLMAQIDVSDKSVDERLRAMIRALPLLKAILAQRNL